MDFTRDGEKTLMNVAILGKSGSGKSSLIRAYTESAFIENLPKTEAMQITHIENDENILAFWEFPDESKLLKGQFLRKTNGIVYLIDMHNLPTKEELCDDFKQISSIDADIPVVIILSKNDMDDGTHSQEIDALMEVISSRIDGKRVKLFKVSSKNMIETRSYIDWIISESSTGDEIEFVLGNSVVSALIKLSDIGPEVMYYDFDKFPDPEILISTEEYLSTLGINLSIALAQGNSFSEGIFELPAGSSKLFRLIVISVKLSDSSLQDERHENQGYGIFCFFMTPEIISRLPKLVNIEDKVLRTLRTISNLGSISMNEYLSIRDAIFKILKNT